MSVLSDDVTTVGQRLRELRLWRRMTVHELGGLAGISGPYVSMLERGLRPLDRRSMIAALATALRVSEVDLVGGAHLGVNPDQSAPHAVIPALRMALETTSLYEPLDDAAGQIEEVATELARIKDLYTNACDYVGAGGRLPKVIENLHTHACLARPEPTRKAALALLVEACISATFVAKDLGYPDLASVAAMRAEEAAQVLGEPVDIGKAALARFHSGPGTLQSWDRRLAAAQRGVSALEPNAREGEGIAVLGMLTLSAALAAAVLHQGDTADDWLAQASELARQVPDDMDANWWSFSQTNVAVWRVGLAVERGESGGKIAELARTVDERKLTTRTRRTDWLVDVGRGVARDPKAASEAVGWLRRAEQTAPQRVRNYAPAREAVGYLMTRANAAAGGRELRGMASRMGVAH